MPKTIHKKDLSEIHQRPEKVFCQISLKAILKNKRGETLILNADRNGTFAGYYDLPGGRINVDEFYASPQSILRREIREEVGPIRVQLDPKLVALGRHIILEKYTRRGVDTPVLYVFFEGRYLGGKINTSREHEGYRWVRLTRANVPRLFVSGLRQGLQSYLQSIL